MSKKKKQLTSQLILNVIMALTALSCVVPFLLIISNSLASEAGFARNGFTLFPKEFCLDAFKYVFQNPSDIIESYLITILITVSGTVLGMLLSVTFAYAISRNEYRHKSFLSFYVYFTMLFSGGMVSSYIWFTKYLGMYNNILVLILPGLMTPSYIFILRAFCKEIPTSLIESARIEGASEWYLFCRIIIPLAKAGIATIALFKVFGYWGSWYNSMLYMDTGRNTTVQYLLVKTLNRAQFAEQMADKLSGMGVVEQVPSEAVRMAICIVAVGPSTIIFPFFQKHFSKGIIVGSVKG